MERTEIIKALECCIETQCENCCNLGNWHEQWNCMTDIMRKALSLIKELTEKYENLEMQFREIDHECDRLEIRNEKLTEENERLKNDRGALCSHLVCAKTEKTIIIADTVRKMQSELKKTFSALCKGEMNDLYRIIDQIAKEIVEGEK